MKASVPVPRGWDGAPRNPKPPPLQQQQPRRREMQAATSPLLGAGKRITGAASARQPAPLPDPDALAAGPSEGARYVPSRGNQSSPTDTRSLDFGERPRAKERPHGSLPVDASELAKGGEALLKRLADLNSANVELRRQLDHQHSELAGLESSGRAQQQRLQDLERRREQSRRDEALAIEARARAEAAGREAQLQAELDEGREAAQRDREELEEQLRRRRAELDLRQGERDDARARAAELEHKLREALSAPENQEARVRALEMEMNLMRSRIAKETTAREVAEEALRESTAQQQQLQARLGRSSNKMRQLEQALAEQKELVAFRQEVCDDLRSQLQRERAASEDRLCREKGKLGAIERLEGVLPRHLLIKAFS